MMNLQEGKHQLKFVRQGDTLKWVDAPSELVPTRIQPKQQKILVALGIIGLALILAICLDASVLLGLLLDHLTSQPIQDAYLQLR